MKAQEIETEKSSQLEIIELKSKVKNLEKAIIDSNKLKGELEEKSKSEAEKSTQILLELETLYVRNLSKIQDLEMKQEELVTLKEKDKEMVANLSQHTVKIKELEDIQIL